jgi:hypothetical protein
MFANSKPTARYLKKENTSDKGSGATTQKRFVVN